MANGLNAQGRMLLYSGRVPEGLALLDEAMVGIATGEVSPIFAGEIYCSLIEACQEVSDYGRAAEWTSALTSWIEAQPGLVPFTGQCAVHRGQIMRVRGAFAEAVEEFTLATERYAAADTPAPAGLAMAECGEVLRILGDLPAAEAAYERAVGFGYEAQPGRSLLWLDRGRTAAAVGAVNRLLAEPLDPVHRSQLLPGAVEVLLAAGEVDQAGSVADELAAHRGDLRVRRAAGHGRLRARPRPPRRRAGRAGRARAAAGDGRVAVARRAVRGGACRVLQLGLALRVLGDDESAHRRDRSRSGDVRRRSVRLPPSGRRPGCSATAHPAGSPTARSRCCGWWRAGSSNPEIAATLVLSEKTVARHLSNIFTKLDVGSRTAAAAFAFENGLV